MEKNAVMVMNATDAAVVKSLLLSFCLFFGKNRLFYNTFFS